MDTLTLIQTFFAMKQNEHKSWDEIRKVQEKKFREILAHAFHHSSFYHDLYSSHGITEKDLDTVSIEKLPIVDKDIIMDHFDDIVTTPDLTFKEVTDFLDRNKTPYDLFKKKYHILHSSGSSGKIGIFSYSGNDWNKIYPYITKAYTFKLKKNKSVFYGATDGHYAGVSFSSWGGKGIMKLFNNPLILDIKRPIEGHIQKLNSFQPTILGGYFTGLKILAQQQEKGELDIHPEIIVNCGEGVIPKDMEYIESIFRAPMTNLYGVAECCILGVGKESYGGIALFDDIAIIEIKKDHILLTNLFNKTQPLIRYRIDDYLKEIKTDHKDFPFTIVEDVIGREELVIWLENKDGKKDFIHPIVIAEFYVKGLDKLQIVQTSDTSFIFRAVIVDPNQKEVIGKIKEKLQILLAAKDFTNVTFSIEVVDHLSVDSKTGKFKLIIKNDDK
jgi:phenylacetate-CoA ligase